MHIGKLYRHSKMGRTLRNGTHMGTWDAHWEMGRTLGNGTHIGKWDEHLKLVRMHIGKCDLHW